MVAINFNKDMYDTTSALTLFKCLKNERVYDLWEDLEGMLSKDFPKSIKVVRFDLSINLVS